MSGFGKSFAAGSLTVSQFFGGVIPANKDNSPLNTTSLTKLPAISGMRLRFADRFSDQFVVASGGSSSEGAQPSLTELLALNRGMEEDSPKTADMDAKPGVVGIAKFATGQWPAGWQFTGDCWRDGPTNAAKYRDQITGNTDPYYAFTAPNGNNSLTGTAVSPIFTIDKPFINFEIMGGNEPGKTCINLVIDGKIVRTCAGNASLSFSKKSWDVYSLQGKEAQLQIVDDSKSQQYGFVGVGNVELSKKPETPLQTLLSQELEQTRNKLNLPCLGGVISVRGQIVAIETIGVDQTGTNNLYKPEQPVFIGSISKPVTAYILSHIVKDGFLKWTDTFRQICPEIAKKYSNNTAIDATLAHFICHTSGLGGADRLPPAGTPIEWRLKRAESLLAAQTVGSPGQVYSYAGGLSLAVLMAEKVTGLSYENLLKKYCSDLPSVRLGLASDLTPGVDCPIGHIYEDASGRFLKFGDQYVGLYRTAPSGSVGVDGAITGNLYDLVKVFSRGAGYEGEFSIDKSFYQKVRETPFAFKPQFTLGSFIKWADGRYFCGGSGGAEVANVQLNDENKSVLFIYTNRSSPRSEPDIGDLIYRLNTATAKIN